MKMMKKVIAATLAVSMLPAISVMAEEDTLDILVMPKLVGIPWFNASDVGAMRAGEELGVNVIYAGPTQADAAEQVKMIEDYLNQGVDAICIAANDPAAVKITGQPWITPTWTATKLRWFYKNNPAILAKTWKVLLLKDYILFCLTGKTVSESSIRGFSYLFDINKREHWQEMVKYCGIQNDQMPEVIEPCKRIGSVLPQIKKILPEAGDYIVNVGTLDHIAGMLGSNAYFPGTAAESAGTVLSLSILSDTWNFDPQKKIACLIGPEAGRYILFDCCDSGGVCMEWIKNEFLSEITYGRLERLLQKVNINTAPTFLPYLTGINPPEYYPDARGAFLGLSLGHSKIDMAYSVMEGVACMLHNNLKYCEEAGIAVERIVSSGGGANSKVWNQIKANICKKLLLVPKEKNASAFGAAMIGAVDAGIFHDLPEACKACADFSDTYFPEVNEQTTYERRFKQYENYKNLLAPSFYAGKE